MPPLPPRAALPLIAAQLLIATAAVADDERGAALFDNHCTGCHHPALLERRLRHVRDVDSLRYFVDRWAREIDIDWARGERADVVDYLNRRYYRFTLKP